MLSIEVSVSATAAVMWAAWLLIWRNEGKAAGKEKAALQSGQGDHGNDLRRLYAMNAETRKLPISPEYQAWEDWRAEGAFFSSQLHGAERDRYRAEAQRIEREMNQ